MAKLIYASTKNRDLFYALKTEISDPIFFIETGGEWFDPFDRFDKLTAGKLGANKLTTRKYVFLDYRELDFFKEKNKHSNIETVLLNPLLEEAAKIYEKTASSNKLGLCLIKKFVKEAGAIEVPSDFPLEMAVFLRTKGIIVSPKNPLYPERAVKTQEEILLIKETAKRTLNVFKKIEEILRDGKINNDCITYGNEVLTSEFLKKEAAIEMARQELIDSEGIIISSGAHSAIPHHPGAGPIKANQPIVCDIFPRNKISGYFSDITRTYVKGVPSKEISAMFDAVLRAQKNAVSMLKAGIQAREIHNACNVSFKESGFETSGGGGFIPLETDRPEAVVAALSAPLETKFLTGFAGRPLTGFIHSTGHGVGLEVHERPSIGPNSEAILEPGNVITVEPGLYYPEIGGIRIEDMFLITEQGAVCLTEHPRKLVVE